LYSGAGTWRNFRSFVKPMYPADSPSLVSLADYERAAERALDAGAWAYFAGAAADEITARDNIAAWSRLAIRPRVLVGVEDRDPSVTLLGKRRPHPVLIAPMAHQRLAHPERELGTARAAAATGTIMCLATLATTSPVDLAEAVPDASRWFQLYVFKDRGVSHELVAVAVENGYEALVITADLPVVGTRERELRNEIRTSPANVGAGEEGAVSPWDFAERIDPSLTWADVERFAANAGIPVLIKGVLTPEDALRAERAGAAGVVVSNHGGRQLDTVLSGADALPAIVDELAGALDVIVDGGIRRGTDVLKALALGADAVMVGRPVLYGLALEGESGARRVLEILLGELDTALGLAGARRASELDRSFLAAAPWSTAGR
jgi:isopentenyl diphosphate isomerase/L-lactate dehydrogenase-like FMN-dependent dehydrogenase